MEAILQAKEISKTYHTGSVDVPALKQCSLEYRLYISGLQPVSRIYII